MEAARGLARLRLANLVNVHSFQRSESAANIRQREKSYYYDARETHYNRASRMVRPRYAGSHPPVTIRCYDLYTYVISILQYNRERVNTVSVNKHTISSSYRMYEYCEVYEGSKAKRTLFTRS